MLSLIFVMLIAVAPSARGATSASQKYHDRNAPAVPDLILEQFTLGELMVTTVAIDGRWPRSADHGLVCSDAMKIAPLALSFVTLPHPCTMMTAFTLIAAHNSFDRQLRPIAQISDPSDHGSVRRASDNPCHSCLPPYLHCQAPSPQVEARLQAAMLHVGLFAVTDLGISAPPASPDHDQVWMNHDPGAGG